MQLTKVYFMIMVDDMDRTVSFYREVFALQPILESPYWTELSFGNALIALHAGGPPGDRDTGLGLEVDDLDAACLAVEAHGGQVIEEPKARPEERIRIATAADPSGNRFTLGQALA
jgi:predicted enzyme related to lactoylglutathione lyase